MCTCVSVALLIAGRLYIRLYNVSQNPDQNKTSITVVACAYTRVALCDVRTQPRGMLNIAAAFSRANQQQAFGFLHKTTYHVFFYTEPFKIHLEYLHLRPRDGFTST